MRWLLLLCGALCLSGPYFSPRLIGTADALWYHHLLADAVTQFRAGVFPVYVGQSDYSFNGAVYPLRAAPYHQYLAGFLDLLSGRSLGFFALQHATIVLSFVAGAFSAYFSLLWISGARRWTAAFLALLYVTSPGVAGLFYAQDLYMSGMTLPWVPLAFAALVRTFDDPRARPGVILAAALATLWWAHSPIALWVTLIAGLSQVVRLARGKGTKARVPGAAAAAAVFCVLAAYPIVSVFLLRSPGETIVPYVMDRELLLKWVSGSFPSSIEPLDPAGPGLNHLQLGYSLWLVFAAAIALGFTRVRVLSVALLLAAAAFLLILVFPVPFLTRVLWMHFPETLVGMTLYWPMQRLYIVVAAATVVGFYRLVCDDTSFGPRILAFTQSVLGVGLLWSGYQAFILAGIAGQQGGTVAESSRYTLTENVAVQRHTYGLFARRPAYFSHGVVDPRMEARLLDLESGGVIATDYAIAPNGAPMEELRGTVDVNPGILNLAPALVLEPGRRYLLTFAFAQEDTTGVLQMNGDHFFREYGLPESGEEKAFGSGPKNEKSITVWTSLPSPETVKLRFIPTGGTRTPSDYLRFAKIRLSPLDPATLPIRVTSLIPFQAGVRSPGRALLETPRMFVPGYEATVNGARVPVLKSPEGLIMFSVPAGESRVELRFTGPVLLRAAFWGSAIGWVVALVLGSFGAFRALRGASPKTPEFV